MNFSEQLVSMNRHHHWPFFIYGLQDHGFPFENQLKAQLFDF